MLTGTICPVLQSGTQEPQAPFKSVTSLVVHFNSTNGVTTGDNDMLMNNTIGSDQRTNKDMPEQVRLSDGEQTTSHSGFACRMCIWAPVDNLVCRTALQYAAFSSVLRRSSRTVLVAADTTTISPADWFC